MTNKHTARPCQPTAERIVQAIALDPRLSFATNEELAAIVRRDVRTVGRALSYLRRTAAVCVSYTVAKGPGDPARVITLTNGDEVPLP